MAGVLTGTVLLATDILNVRASPARLALGAPADGLRLEVPDPSISVRSNEIPPIDTDPSIDIALEPHYIAFSPVPPRGQLFLWLTGIGGLPTRTRLITDQAARNGFHAVNLRYPNENADAVQNLCGFEPDRTCFENARLAVLTGDNPSTTLSISRTNSVENRVLKLLAYLEAKYPSEGWGTFVEGDSLTWSSIIVAGLSEGGGHAAILARDHVIARVAMLSAPFDRVGLLERSNSPAEPASWLLGAHLTPSERYFAFGHVNDETTNWALQWPATNLGLSNLGLIANVDGVDAPYGESHMLLTSATPQNAVGFPQANHASTAADSFTPLDEAGQPVFARVWQYVCFA
jgi:hypothetical protein